MRLPVIPEISIEEIRAFRSISKFEGIKPPQRSKPPQRRGIGEIEGNKYTFKKNPKATTAKEKTKKDSVNLLAKNNNLILFLLLEFNLSTIALS
ncbi:MAG TPA: hypothetical protein ENH98_02040 [archaeon]|nr:hypothetical protein [archaeon]